MILIKKYLKKYNLKNKKKKFKKYYKINKNYLKIKLLLF